MSDRPGNPPPRRLTLDSDGKVCDAASKTLDSTVIVSGRPAVQMATESPVTTVTRWRDWRFDTDRG